MVTGPLRWHRGNEIAPASRLREIAGRHETPLLDPEDVNAPPWPARLAAYEADLLVVCDFGQILLPDTLAAARRGGINLHASLLPKYRGAAPINWAIYNGDRETGVTVIHMTPQLDAGPCIAQARTEILPDETTGQLETRLADMGAALVQQAIRDLQAGRVEALPQDAALASRAPRLKKTDGLIDWSRPAEAIRNHVRAMDPWPKTYTFWHRHEAAPLRLIVGPVAVLQGSRRRRRGPCWRPAAGNWSLPPAWGPSCQATSSRPANASWRSASFSAAITSGRAIGLGRRNCQGGRAPEGRQLVARDVSPWEMFNIVRASPGGAAEVGRKQAFLSPLRG